MFMIFWPLMVKRHPYCCGFCVSYKSACGISLTIAFPVSARSRFILSNEYLQHTQMRVSKFENCIFTEYIFTSITAKLKQVTNDYPTL